MGGFQEIPELLKMDYGQHYTEYQLKKRSLFRHLTRKLYLSASLRMIQGRTIDFGCGVGELLQKLPVGSIGLEINKTTIITTNALIMPINNDQFLILATDAKASLVSIFTTMPHRGEGKYLQTAKISSLL